MNHGRSTTAAALQAKFEIVLDVLDCIGVAHINTAKHIKEKNSTAFCSMMVDIYVQARCVILVSYIFYLLG
jgi:hypothetical protein